MPRYDRWSPQQEKTIQLVKTLRKEGLGYRKIAKHLNENGLTTHNGKKWGGNNVYAVLKRHKEREERLEFINREYEPEWSKMEVRWEKNSFD